MRIASYIALDAATALGASLRLMNYEHQLTFRVVVYAVMLRQNYSDIKNFRREIDSVWYFQSTRRLLAQSAPYPLRLNPYPGRHTGLPRP